MAKKKGKRAGARKSVSKKARAKRPVSRSKAKKSVKPSRKKSAKKSVKKASSGKFNLIVTYDPNHEGTAKKELEEVLAKIGEKPRIADSGVGGLFKVYVSDARRVVKRLADLCKADPNLFVATNSYTPIDAWCSSEPEAMQKKIKPLESGIGTSERWKMVLNKRHWDKMKGTKLIIKLTESISRAKVDLENPQKIVQVEIIGKEAGISLIEPGEALNVPKLKEEA